MPTKIQVVETGICPDTFDDTELPTDVHIITFTKDGERQFDAVRAYSKADIFDEYYDKLGRDNPIHSIESGYGRVKPKLYGKIKTEDWLYRRTVWNHTNTSRKTYSKTVKTITSKIWTQLSWSGLHQTLKN